MTASWTIDSIPSLASTTVIVTGASSGIGLEAARVFAAKGAQVVFAVRDEKKGRHAAASVTGSTEVRPLDLADLGLSREFAEEWTGDIHLLISNAGVLVPPFGHTKDGSSCSSASTTSGTLRSPICSCRTSRAAW